MSHSFTGDTTDVMQTLSVGPGTPWGDQLSAFHQSFAWPDGAPPTQERSHVRVASPGAHAPAGAATSTSDPSSSAARRARPRAWLGVMWAGSMSGRIVPVRARAGRCVRGIVGHGGAIGKALRTASWTGE